ncbi:hypothetical protein [Neptunicella sp. SCSIO 80796]|uniref:hypothetical protein n=1 Tax=Neptunicella plasticusilytica TaxID=3117012 RepID=UPI003A4E355A
MFFSVVGVLFTLAGIACLYKSWNSKIKSSAQVWTGWGSLTISAWCWIQSSGAEFGLSYALISLSVVALILIGWKAEIAVSPKVAIQPEHVIVYRPAAIPRNLLLFLLTVPVAGMAAMMITMLLNSLLPLSRVNMMVLSVYLMPVVWGLAAYWVCADDKLARPALGLSVMGGLSALFIYV